MDEVGEITEKGNQYAKRMLDRKKDLNRSFECYSKTLRRKLSIMEAIQKPIISTNSSFCNPFEREFPQNNDNNSSNGEVKPRYVVSWTVNISDPQNNDEIREPIEKYSQSYGFKEGQTFNTYAAYQLDSSHCTDKYLNSFETNSDDFEYQCVKENRKETLQVVDVLQKKQVQSKFKDSAYNANEQENEPRVSLGEYFGGKSQKELTRPNFLTDEAKYGNVKAPERRSQGSALLFGARVLEVLEPEIVNVERKSSVAPDHRRASELTLVQESFKSLNLQQADSTLDDSITTSLVSEDIREIDKDIDALQFQSDVLQVVEKQYSEGISKSQQQNKISETPKRLYPDLSSLRRASDNFTPKKLFHTNKVENNTEISDTDINCNLTESFDESQKQRNIINNETFSTPMTIPASQLNNLDYNNRQDYHDSSAVSYLKNNTSFHVNNLHVPRQKPNLESTRKIFSSGGDPISPDSQIGTTISTLTLPNTPATPLTDDTVENNEQHYQNHSIISNHQQQGQYKQQVNTNMQRNNMEHLPYEVENFLELALGDEQYNTSVTYAASEMYDRTNVNASEFISEESTPIPKNKISKINRQSVPETPKRSNTLNRTLSAYKTLTKRIKRKFRGSDKSRMENDNEQSSFEANLAISINPNVADSVKELLGILKTQQTLIAQASKALEVCQSMREFMASTERVESERALILANLRWKAAEDEINRLHSQRADSSLYCERGEVILSEMSLRLRDDIIRREYINDNIIEWLFIVVSEGPVVHATKVVQCPTTGTRLYFSEELSIPGLTPDFRLSVSVYGLKLQMLEFTHEDKYHIRKDENERDSIICPSPQRLLNKSEKRPMVSPKQCEIRYLDIKKSAFDMCGSVDLMLSDLNLKSPWPLTGVSQNSVLHGTIDMCLKCNLQLSVSHAGFLTHGGEAGGFAAWNRLWCVLENHKLMFWNYPSEPESANKNKKPLYTIDLLNCVSRRISLVDRSLCAKPRTLLVETSRKRKSTDKDSMIIQCRSSITIVRNLLSCDTNQDLTEWQSKLNHVISSLRQWNIISSEDDSSFTTSGISLS